MYDWSVAMLLWKKIQKMRTRKMLLYCMWKSTLAETVQWKPYLSFEYQQNFCTNYSIVLCTNGFDSRELFCKLSRQQINQIPSFIVKVPKHLKLMTLFFVRNGDLDLDSGGLSPCECIYQNQNKYWENETLATYWLMSGSYCKSLIIRKFYCFAFIHKLTASWILNFAKNKPGVPVKCQGSFSLLFG